MTSRRGSQRPSCLHRIQNRTCLVKGRARSGGLVWILVLLVMGVAPAHAAPTLVVIEIDPAAEQMLDPRGARRLIQLELGDVDVPPPVGHDEPRLFYRVLGDGTGVRVELWERGDLIGSREVSSAQGSALLTSRRVALAAAEIARHLRQQRILRARTEEREKERREAEARALSERTLDGPVALRSSVSGLLYSDFRLLGTSLTEELSIRGATRLDLAVNGQAGWLQNRSHRLTWLSIEVGPAHRWALGDQLDLDLGAFVAAGVVSLGGALGVDGVEGQTETWSARAGLSLRLEPRLTRDARLELGLVGGTVLRDVPVQLRGEETRSYGGGFVGLEVGVVLTPAPPPAETPSGP